MNVEGTVLYSLYQRINSVRRAGKDWAQRKRLADESSRKTAAALQIEATKLQADPHNPTIQAAYKELKIKLIELQHRELLSGNAHTKAGSRKATKERNSSRRPSGRGEQGIWLWRHWTVMATRRIQWRE